MVPADGQAAVVVSGRQVEELRSRRRSKRKDDHWRNTAENHDRKQQCRAQLGEECCWRGEATTLQRATR